MTGQARPRKRHRPEEDAIELFDRLVDSSQRVIELVDRPQKLEAAHDELARLSDLASQLDNAAQKSESAGTALLSSACKDQLDSLGTSLWNKSLGLKSSAKLDDKLDDKSASALAAVRSTAFQLICLGTIESESEAARIQRLSLGTKCATALLDAAQSARAETLVTQLGAIASALASFDSLPTDAARKRIKCLLHFYCCRIRITSARGLTPIAYWLKDKAKALLAHPSVTKREIEKLALTAYETGITLLRSGDESDQSQQLNEEKTMQRNEASLEWLQLALELLERQGDEATITLQVEVLKALAHALISAIPPRSRWQQAEEVLRQALELVPRDGTLSRRLLKLVVARGGSEDEIQAAFLNAASRLQSNPEEAYGLIAALELLPEHRRQSKIHLIVDLCEALATEQDAAGQAALSQLVSAAFLQAADSDVSLLGQCLSRIYTKLPNFRLHQTEAFASATCLWRFGEKLEQDHNFRNAADWYLLGTHDCFGKLDPGTRAKLARKAAFALVHAGDRSQAKRLLDSPILRGDLAKNHFLRFYANEGDQAGALDALNAMLNAPDADSDLLLWTHKVAIDRGDHALAKQTLQAIGVRVLDADAGQGASIQIDALVLVRSLIRLLVADVKAAATVQDRNSLSNDIHEQLAIAVRIARARAESGGMTDVLTKDVTWLYKTAYNVCAENCHEWDAILAKSMFGRTAEIMSFLADDGQLVDAETLQKLALCRLAYLIALTEEARACEDHAERLRKYQTVHVAAEDLLQVLSSPLHVASARTVDIVGAALAVQVEAVAEAGEWSKIAELAATFETDASKPLSVLKVLVARAADRHSSCPQDILFEILQKALAVLYARRDLDQARLALWLRSIVSMLLHRRQLPEARKYVENAIHFLSQPDSDYPADEAEWMAATAWDEGVDCYAASAPVEGRQWCELGVRVAMVTNALLAHQWRNELAQLEERFAQSLDS